VKQTFAGFQRRCRWKVLSAGKVNLQFPPRKYRQFEIQRHSSPTEAGSALSLIQASFQQPVINRPPGSAASNTEVI
jgi:hypothetical protein